MDNNLGKRIRRFRKLKGLTLEDLGEKAGVCCKYVGEIERGIKTPTVTVLQKVASALDVHACVLLSSFSTEEGYLERFASINRILHGRDAETLEKINKILKIVFDEKY
ncbi:MAG: helix-turn-helix transcriptional regulator [Nitrospirae bacterium]|nr:helix-turn-helix transcriptional regulator [Nitrospirota bacterium]